MRKGVFVVLGGNVFTSILQICRNILIARLVSVEDYGIAATFGITMALLENASNLALERLIVQASDGESHRLQAVLHSLQALRGALVALILYLAAGTVADWFGVSELAWAYEVVALIPLLRSFTHLDMFRAHRQMRFGYMYIVGFVAQLAAALAAIPLALELGDYRAMLYSLLVQQIVFLVMSHVVATRPYRLDWDFSMVRRGLSFGWPLLLNNLLMFGIFYGDRIIVGNQLGAEQLGLFGAVFTLTLMPTVVILRSMQTFFMPLLSSAQDDESKFGRLFLVVTQSAVIVGVGLALFFALFGPELFIALFGAKYDPALPLLTWLSVVQAVRVAKTGPSIAAVAKAETRNPLIANVFRALMLPVAWILVHEGAGIMAVVWTALFGEVIALAISLVLAKRTLSVPLRGGAAGALLAAGGALALICLDSWIWPPNADIFDHIHLMQLVLVAATGVLVVMSKQCRLWAWAVLRQREP